MTDHGNPTEAGDRPARVCLMGSDGGGWALDQDLDTIRTAFRELGGRVEESALEDADVVHSVWEEPLLRMDPERLAGRRLVATACNDMPRTLAQSFMNEHTQRIGLWIAISRRAEQQMQGFRMPHRYIPYTVNTAHFTPVPPRPRADLRAKWGVPEGRYVVSSFMRDTLGADLRTPKPQKGVELFVGIVTALAAAGCPVHVLLAGPRRHWLREELSRRGIPFSYAGRVVDGDDVTVNIQPPATMNELYHASDICLVTSRWEGGPRAVLEAAATRTRILCSAVGLAEDVLDLESVFRDPDRAVRTVLSDWQNATLSRTVEPQYRRVTEAFVPACNITRFQALYASVQDIPPFRPVACGSRAAAKRGSIVRFMRRACAYAASHAPAVLRRGIGPRISILHEFHKPPYGGGNQFMMGLAAALRRKGARLVINRVAPDVDVYVCNSAWFDVDRLRRASRRRVPRVIHRVDGFISLYRASSRAEDDKVYALNSEFATVTLFQSAWSLRVLREAGYEPRTPMIVRNAVDPRIFHARARTPFAEGGKVRLITTAWSDNPKKGGPFYSWIEENLDFARFDYTFVGRTKTPLSRARQMPAQPSEGVASALRAHDIYITASEHECCSNAVLEALACGLPVLYLDSGAQAELVGFGGLGFGGREDFFGQLQRLVDSHALFRDGIWSDSMDSVARTYLELAERIAASSA